jgi:hypothetical protein
MIVPIAHIGNVPVEEYAPFVAPVVLLIVYARRRDRRDRKALARLPGVQALDERTTERVLVRWADGGHTHVTRELLPLMYPPGPDGVGAHELAERIDADPTSVSDRLEELADLGYLELDGGPDVDEPCGWLTLEGINLLNLTEEALLSASNAPSPRPASER